MMQQSTRHRLLCFAVVLVLGALMPACGGGGGGGSDGGMNPLSATFTPTTANPGANTINMAGSSSGQNFTVVVQVTGVNDFFGAGFRVTFDPASAQYVSFSSNGSLLLGHGVQTNFTVTPSTGELLVSATILDATQPAGIDVAGTLPLITLNFRATNTTAGNLFAFDTAATRLVKICPTQGGSCNNLTEPPLSWSGGTLTASR